MNIRERLFCYYYAKFQNHKEAALKSGFDKDKADIIGMRLIAKDEIKTYVNYILNEDKKNDLMQKSIIGLERLAFGSVCDPVKLLFIETLDELDLSEMDLFNVSEIKKVKGGGFEIKFFDRIKALEAISNISQLVSKDDGSSDLFGAIEKSANAISKIANSLPETEEEHNE